VRRRVLGEALGSLASSAAVWWRRGRRPVPVRPRGRMAVTSGVLASQGKHTPFDFAATGMALPGRVRATLVAGTVAYEAG